LKRKCPQALLTDKDRVNRVALWARHLASVPTKVAVRIGTTVSENLARRSWFHRRLQYYSIGHFYPWAHAIIVPSHGVAEDLARIMRVSIAKIRVVPSPVVSGFLEQMAAEPVNLSWLSHSGSAVILGVGELCERKDFSTLIRAFAKVRQERSSRLIILGEGRQRERLGKLVRDLGLNSDVYFPGFVTNPYAYMKKAALFVLSSRCEGAPVVLIEALALGLPVVSTDCPSGPREILEDGKIGPLVPVGDVGALAQAILKTLDNRPDPEILKNAAQRYSVASSASQYLEILGFSEKQGDRSERLSRVTFSHE
jgi:glycosyltransferase involved in cell wall biosynthesis